MAGYLIYNYFFFCYFFVFFFFWNSTLDWG